MARSIRIEYPGAFYHVMARGNRREAIFLDDDDRRFFLRALGEACEKTGWKVHAWVLMRNHYHLLIETPQANLVPGMQWLQNTFTRRFNVRHRAWGRLFGDRYKAVLVEGCRGLKEAELEDSPRSDARKVALARLIWRRTTVTHRWIAERMKMGEAANVSQQLRQGAREQTNLPKALRRFIDRQTVKS